MEFMGPQQKSMINLIIMLCFGHIFFQAFTSLNKCAYNFFVMLYWYQILNSIFLSPCFVSISTGFCISFWNWLIIGIIDLSLCTTVLSQYYQNDHYYY